MINCDIITEYSNFQNIFIQVLNNQAPVKKKKLVPTNPFMTKPLKKAIMKRSKLKNRYIWKRKNWESYKKERNFCVDLLHKTKTERFENLNDKNLPDNPRFWKTIKPYLSNKGSDSKKILLKKKGNLVSGEKEPL